ncbi:unnamed protein product [Vitrella brassicaformis CCMP3155]|uniref:C3H1-type domain-containing protein n=2 Tax=Vitrella brassicaformis TaxID=1169539 RepID=A0A0G4F7W6_VITBC|nr:unnamed protein product [Vitrella brassicaformis CCMP3155]|eukprot:CEM08760.1 unnamed protein product [Vitrella brassicaformis CCMP3155]
MVALCLAREVDGGPVPSSRGGRTATTTTTIMAPLPLTPAVTGSGAVERRGSGSGTTSGGGGGSLESSRPVDQWYKTKLCPFFKRKRCNKGLACNYAHSRAELRTLPDLAKTSICDAYLKGACGNKDCKFAHGASELRVTPDYYKTKPCHNWQDGFCPYGESCRHAHGEADRRPRVYRATAQERHLARDYRESKGQDKATKQAHPGAPPPKKPPPLLSTLIPHPTTTTITTIGTAGKAITAQHTPAPLTHQHQHHHSNSPSSASTTSTQASQTFALLYATTPTHAQIPTTDANGKAATVGVSVWECGRRESSTSTILDASESDSTHASTPQSASMVPACPVVGPASAFFAHSSHKGGDECDEDYLRGSFMCQWDIQKAPRGAGAAGGGSAGVMVRQGTGQSPLLQPDHVVLDVVNAILED